MNIDKKDLNTHIWYEDRDGNIIYTEDCNSNKVADLDELRQKYGEPIYYHTLFPLEVTEHIDVIKFDKDTNEHTFNHVVDFNSHIGGGNEKVIVAMVNSGDYTLSEAIYLWSQSCERCMNVLAYKYLDGKEGYPEYSEEWKKCNTSCKFCRDDEIKTEEGDTNDSK